MGTPALSGSLLWTDDIALFSATRRLSHDQDPTLPLIESEFAHLKESFVLESRAEAACRFEHRFGEARLSLRGEGLIFPDHHAYDHPLLGAELESDLPGSNHLLLRYIAIPGLLLGRNAVRPLPEEEGPEALELAREEFDSHLFALGLGHDFGQALHLRLFGRYGLRRYDPPFQHRDHDLWTVGLHLEWTPGELFELLLGYHFERAYAEGRHEPDLRDDISYRSHFVTGELRFPLTRRLALEVGGHYERMGWTSSIEGDPRRGEFEDLAAGEAALLWQVAEEIGLKLFFQAVHRKESYERRATDSYTAGLGFTWVF